MMPYVGRCEHLREGWCIACVGQLPKGQSSAERLVACGTPPAAATGHPSIASDVAQDGVRSGTAGTGDAQEPFAWAGYAERTDGGSVRALRWKESDAADEVFAKGTCQPRTLVPLYRSPALTEAEREALRFCGELARLGERPDLAATLRGLLERMK